MASNSSGHKKTRIFDTIYKFIIQSIIFFCIGIHIIRFWIRRLIDIQVAIKQILIISGQGFIIHGINIYFQLESRSRCREFGQFIWFVIPTTCCFIIRLRFIQHIGKQAGLHDIGANHTIIPRKHLCFYIYLTGTIPSKFAIGSKLITPLSNRIAVIVADINPTTLLSSPIRRRNARPHLQRTESQNNIRIFCAIMEIIQERYRFHHGIPNFIPHNEFIAHRPILRSKQTTFRRIIADNQRSRIIHIAKSGPNKASRRK